VTRFDVSLRALTVRSRQSEYTVWHAGEARRPAAPISSFWVAMAWVSSLSHWSRSCGPQREERTEGVREHKQRRGREVGEGEAERRRGGRGGRDEEGGQGRKG